jgi:transposase
LIGEYDEIEIPPVKPYVVRHRRFACRCAHCGAGVKAPAPAVASTIASKKRELEKQLAALLAAATECDLARQLQAKIGRAQDQLLIFCDYPGEVEATNNGSERKLRPCVIQRKVTNGYRAMWAAQAEADVRTTVDTERLKGANPFQTILDTLV